MNTVLRQDQSVLLYNISWPSYVQIADAIQLHTPAHVTYDRGTLEIMVTSYQHERIKKILARIFESLAIELDIDWLPAGSTTFRKQDLERGFEPDESYYTANAEHIRGREEIDLEFDPPPDLTIEVDVSSSSLNRMSIFAAVGIPEVWRWFEAEVHISALAGGKYGKVKESAILPGVTGEALTDLLDLGLSIKQKDFRSRIEEYAKSIKK